MSQAIFFPGQGAQFRGMGRELFGQFPALTRLASDILGYSIEQLCVEDPETQLSKTQFTQPALFVVNALAFYARRDAGSLPKANYFAGHSLGEYNALLAAGAFSFEDGLQLVKRRGELMGEATGGGMAAVIGMPAEDARSVLQREKLDEVELANFNTPTQLVISGRTEQIASAAKRFAELGVRCVILNVGAAFHSRHMVAAQEVFREHLKKFRLRDPETPVIANVTARPYRAGQLAEILGGQIASPVLWKDSVVYLLAQGVTAYVEIGGTVLTKMSDEIRRSCGPEVERLRASAAPVSGHLASPARYFQPW